MSPTPCSICGDTEPFHAHNGHVRIENYFTVGRDMTDLEAANAWKSRALDTETVLRLLQLGLAQFDPATGELRFDGMRYSASDFDFTTLLDIAGRDHVQRAIEKARAGK